MSQPTPSLQTWMTLGRISNLPTVWTNALAAALLASSASALAPPSPWPGPCSWPLPRRSTWPACCSTT